MEKSEGYKALSKSLTPKSKILKNCIMAFTVGGLICLSGELLASLYVFLGAGEKASYTLVTVSLIFISSLLTAAGFFDNIARRAGAGTLVPVTGFANAVASPAIDTKSEGLILGVGSKIFTVSGPVILFAVLSGSIYGAVYYLVNLL